MSTSAVNHFLGLCTAEWRKLRGRGLLATVFLLAGAHGVGAVALMGAASWLSRRAAGPDAKDVMDVLVAGEVSLDLLHAPLMSLALLLTYAILWAEDWSLGTLASIWSRPTPRIQVFLAKAATGVAVTLLVYGLGLSLGLLLGLGFGFEADLSQLRGTMFVGWMADTPDSGVRALAILQAMPLLLLEAAPTLALMALLAGITRSAVMTLFGGMVLLLADAGLTLGLRLWGSLDVRGAAKAKVLQEWTMMASRGLYDLHEGGASLAQGAGDSLRSLLYVAVFLGLAWPLWSGRDVS